LADSVCLFGDDSEPKPPPGTHVVYEEVGGKKVPIFVKDQYDFGRIGRKVGDDPLDPQKVFSETNAAQNKAFKPADFNINKSSDLGNQDNYVTKVYGNTAPTSVYNLRDKPTYPTASFDGAKSAAGYNQTFATKGAPANLDQASQFAPIGAQSEQNRKAPIDARPYATYAAPQANKDYAGPEAEIIRKQVKPGRPIDGDLQQLTEIPNRPLTIDEVRNLINHGFKANLDEPPAPASKPLNDPNYQPEPLRIEPPVDDAPSAAAHKVLDDDANDPVPSPGTMAEHPEDSQPLPKK